ncbi:MAG: right-handed parallel beta-helix repeat-containing protein [Planctomycetota bacterium]|jgi:hypothetical protein
MRIAAFTLRVIARGILLAAVSCPTDSSAAEHWVSPQGSDDAPGSRQRPFRSIRRGVEAARPGDTVFVRAGRYEENVSVPSEKSGAPGQWLTISAAPGDERKAIVGTETPRVDAYGSQSSAFSLSEVEYVRLRGFYCVAPYRGRGSGIGAGKSRHFEILDCVVTGGGQGGIDANHCDYVTVDGVEAFCNGGGSGWSSGISLLGPKTKENVVRNCISYGNYDNSSYRSDGNGIIIDNGYAEGGALLANNLCFMNGGKGICSTRSDNCVFLHNTSAANCRQPVQQPTAHELSVRGADNVVRNNIGVSTLPGGVGMQALLTYSGPMGRVEIDPKTIRCDHNLFFNPLGDACVVIAGNRRDSLSLNELRKTMPHWATATLCRDPGFVDLENLDFRLRPDGPAVRAGVAAAEVRTDRLGRPRPAAGPCSLGCYEGGYAEPLGPYPQPGVEIAPGENRQAIEALLDNEYDLLWHGMLWGWGRLLPEELPLEVDVEGPRKADFLNLSGRFVLRELLDELARRHDVRLVLRQPEHSKGLSTSPHTIGPRLAIREGADADERAFVRRALRCHLWTQDDRGAAPLVELLPALSAALGVEIRSDPPLSADAKVPMVTRNMKLSAALADVARRLDVRFVIAREDPWADAARVDAIALDEPFGDEDGVVELVVEKPDGRGRIDVFARVQPDACLCARVFDDNSRFLSPAGVDDTGAGAMYHRASTRLERGTRVRLAVIGNGRALCVGREWVLVSHLPPRLSRGRFHVRRVSDWIEVGDVRYVSMNSKG